MIQTKPLESLDQFISTTGGYRQRWEDEWDTTWQPWFRGEKYSQSPMRLRPKLYRSTQKLGALLYIEQELRLDFRRKAALLISERQPSGDLQHWEWYFLMQHYGVPTRLLDWTDSSLVGLFFALFDRTDPKDKADSAIYMIDPWWLNDIVFRSSRSPSKSKYQGIALPDWAVARRYLAEDEFRSVELKTELPLAVAPTHLSRRFAAQRSQFIIFGRDKGNRLVSLGKPKDSRIRKIRIKGDRIPEIKSELAGCGITESMVFPDLDGLGRELYDFWARSA